MIPLALQCAWSDASARIAPKSRGVKLGTVPLAVRHRLTQWCVGPRQVTLNPGQAQTYPSGGVGPRQVTLNPGQAQTYPSGGVGPRQVTLNPGQAQTYPSGGVGPRMAPHFENRGSSKTFQSKNYPNNYPGGKKCTWKFRTSTDSKLSIECDDFQLQHSKNCKKISSAYCGVKGSLTVSDKSSKVTVLFKTNKKKSNTGFSCSVRASVPDSQTTTVDPEPTSECTGCGQVNRANRIVGGEETEMHFSIPYYYCSMTTSDYVLVGDHNLYSASEANSQWMEIAEIVNHPSYDSNTLDNDIALIRLKTEIQFPSDNKIAPVCLPTAGEMYDSVDATITGWGAQQEGGETLVDQWWWKKTASGSWWELCRGVMAVLDLIGPESMPELHNICNGFLTHKPESVSMEHTCSYKCPDDCPYNCPDACPYYCTHACPNF
ncbi:CUB-serine protease [Penaeus vannamei]|uniref:CUB-serine protease n=1 Tax=Penaeus vannamei TaxID=6689 RepID=A0A423TDN0_PENVA|nr:CUB-serine protease [Penaeus vannamei]